MHIIITILIVLFIACLTIMAMSFFTVQHQTAAVIERFGGFHKIVSSGLHMKVPFVDRVAGRLSLRVRQLDVPVQTKSEDNVFLTVVVSVQYYVLTESVYEAFYRLTNPNEQITAYLFDVIRARVPQMKLDEVFERKDDIAVAVSTELAETMSQFGYGIIKALVTDIDPDEKVKYAMNEINAAQRLRVAAVEKAEAERIFKVKAAEAEAESKALQGKGIADQRKEIIHGLRDSVEDFQKCISGIQPEEVMNLVLLTQYFDTLKEIGHSANGTAIFLPHSPSQFSEISNQIRTAFLSSAEMGRMMAK